MIICVMFPYWELEMGSHGCYVPRWSLHYLRGYSYYSYMWPQQYVYVPRNYSFDCSHITQGPNNAY